MIVLGIESSCDETSAAVVQDGKRLLSLVTSSSMDLHATYGGVVPEIAARSHIEAINAVIDQALAKAFPVIAASSPIPNSQIPTPKSDPWDHVDALAVTYGAGLGGSLLIGVLAARTLAILKNKPLYAINHVEAHLYVNFLTEIADSLALTSFTALETQPEFPMLGLIVSGGHSQLVFFKNHFDYTLLGQTGDDAIGEAFDKVAKILGLPYPGGPSVSQKALEGDPHKYQLPKAHMAGKYDFSFSGLKTAVLRLAQKEVGADFTLPSKELPALLNETQKADIAAGFERVAIETIVDKAVMACEEFHPRSFVIGGGVAASGELRRQLTGRLPLPVTFPDFKLCTDNGAMVATLGCFKASLGQTPADPFTLGIAPNLSM